MEITLYVSDMLEEFAEKYKGGKLQLRDVKFHMFKPKVQAAVQSAGSATFRSGDKYERIIAPKTD